MREDIAMDHWYHWHGSQASLDLPFLDRFRSRERERKKKERDKLRLMLMGFNGFCLMRFLGDNQMDNRGERLLIRIKITSNREDLLRNEKYIAEWLY